MAARPYSDAHVQADVAKVRLRRALLRKLTPGIAKLNAQMPTAIAFELGGVAEESADSRASVIAVVPLMIILMLTLLMLQLQSFQSLAMVSSSCRSV